jgi:hypothetical protein
MGQGSSGRYVDADKPVDTLAGKGIDSNDMGKVNFGLW